MPNDKWTRDVDFDRLGTPYSNSLCPSALRAIERFLRERGWFYALNQFLVTQGRSTIPTSDPVFNKYRVSGRKPFDALVLYEQSCNEHVPSILIVDTHNGHYRISVTNRGISIERERSRNDH